MSWGSDLGHLIPKLMPLTSKQGSVLVKKLALSWAGHAGLQTLDARNSVGYLAISAIPGFLSPYTPLTLQLFGEGGEWLH